MNLSHLFEKDLQDSEWKHCPRDKLGEFCHPIPSHHLFTTTRESFIGKTFSSARFCFFPLNKYWTKTVYTEMGNKLSQIEDVPDGKLPSTRSQEGFRSKVQDTGRSDSLKKSFVMGSPLHLSLSRRSSAASGEERDVEDNPDSNNLNATPSRTSSSKHPDCLSKLAKALVTLSHGEENSNGISMKVFTKFICQNHFALGTNLFEWFVKSCKNQSRKQKSALSKETFIASAHRIMDLVGDGNILEFYINVFAEPDETVVVEKFCDFVQACYLLSQGSCPVVVNEAVLKSLVTSVFRQKTAVSVKFIIHWLEANCPRIVLWLHRYLVHRFTVGHRLIADNNPNDSATAGPLNLDTPVLDSSPPTAGSPTRFSFDAAKSATGSTSNDLKLDPMQLWLLAASLPVTFTKQPQPLHKSPSGAGIFLMDPHTFITQMVAAQTPTHWTSLYNSDIHGLSQNRFLHHVMGYRASTVLLIRGEGGYLFCVAIDQEWKDSNLFWGGKDSTVVQISPEYHVLDKGEKLMYFNTCIRGYPYGLHVGLDHKNPLLEVDKDLAKISYRKIPLKLDSIEVWGCGTQQQREAQTDYKRWELKQVEKSRDMKLNAADWNEHPDKYLLDLAGNRPNYSEYKAS